MFHFFRIWILVVGVALAIAGTLLVLLAGTPASGWMNRLLDAPFWEDGPDETTKSFQAWAYSVTFATMAGWGTLLAFIAANPFAARQSWAWWAITTSLAIWYPLDTGRSLYHRVYINAILNTGLLVVLAVPLAFTYGGFS
ncbi:MAG: hypothetical protein WBV06_07675 [Acidimicrobiia bacterium]